MYGLPKMLKQTGFPNNISVTEILYFIFEQIEE
jgi:hypothetical protein